MDYAAQIISVAAMLFQIISFQFKKNSTYLILQGTGGLLFAVSFFLMGAGGYASAVINVIGVVKSFTFAHHNKKLFSRVCMILFICLYAAATVAISLITRTFDALSYVILFAQITGTVAIWTDSARIIRLAQLSIISPAWLANNIVHFSIGGILCHVFIVLSIVVSIIRYGWKGLDDEKGIKRKHKIFADKLKINEKSE